MTRKFIIVILMAVLAAPSLFAAKKDSTSVSLNHYTLTLGLGWTHYINSLEIGKELATINSPGLSLKFFWEPEHRLSLGFETGFYRIYKMKKQVSSDVWGQASMSVVPLLLNIRMRIIDHFYLSAGTGFAIMINKVSGIDGTMTNNVLSLSNYQFSGSYIYPLKKNLLVGGEFKFMDIGKTADWMYTLQAVCAVKF